MNPLLISLLLVGAGLYFGIRNIRLLRNEAALREFVQNNPKASFWVKKHGLDGATKIARESFLPFGIIVSAGLVAAGAWNIWRIYA